MVPCSQHWNFPCSLKVFFWFWCSPFAKITETLLLFPCSQLYFSFVPLFPIFFWTMFPCSLKPVGQGGASNVTFTQFKRNGSHDTTVYTTGQYLTHGHSHITRALAALNSCFGLVGPHQHGITRQRATPRIVFCIRLSSKGQVIRSDFQVLGLIQYNFFKCNLQVWLLLPTSERIATLVNYTCKSFIELIPALCVAMPGVTNRWNR